MPKDTKEPAGISPTDAEEIRKRIEAEMQEKSRRQLEAAQQINKILSDNDLRLVVEQNIKIIPNQ